MEKNKIKLEKENIQIVLSAVLLVCIILLVVMIILLSVKINKLQKENLELIVEKTFGFSNIQDLKITENAVSFWSNDSGLWDNYFWYLTKEDGNWIIHKYLNGVEVK